MELEYVLITPARNEEAYIERTIQSVISQTVLPLKWVIVSDCSTDSTDEIVKKYAVQCNWIEFIRMSNHRDHQFAAKVYSFNEGYEKVKKLSYDIIGNLDADITFKKKYFEVLLEKFLQDSELGVAGTPFIEEKFNSFKDTHMSIEHVSGACQLFRRECFEEIGGYIPNIDGGIDWIAVTTARMKGWKTKTFLEESVYHHRKIGTRNRNILIAGYKHGQKDYFLGGHPIWELLRVLFRMTKKPYIIRGLFLFAGYFTAFICRINRPVSKELIKFHRQEQMHRLKTKIYNALKF